MTQPVFPELPFEGGRIVRFTESHLTARYVSWLNDREVVRFSEQRHKIHSMASARAYFESFAGTPNYFLAIEARDPALGHIGNLSVAVDAANRNADVSILIGEKQAWNRGFGSRAWRAVLSELLTDGYFRKVTAGTMATNQPMLRLMERSDMHIEGVRSRHFLWEGSEVDLIMAAAFAAA
jgi:[ribosomal protein S5]-alanine N-acetyltransferase